MRFTLKELLWILIALIIFEFIIIFPITSSFNPLIILSPILILAVSVITKKFVSSYFNISIEHKIWEFQRYGWYERSQLKKPFPIGLIFPFLLSLLSLGILRIMVFLQFDATNIKKRRMLKKSGLERRTEINESDLAFTSAGGFWSLIILAIIGALPIINLIFPSLPKYAIFYGLWNLIPFGNLDGAKLFFGSKFAWAFTLIIFLVGLVLVFI